MAKPRKEYTDERKRTIITAIDTRKPGETIEQVQKRFKVHTGMVKGWREKLNLPATERGHLPLDVIPDRQKRAYAKKSSGDVRVDVAKKLMTLATSLLSEAD